MNLSYSIFGFVLLSFLLSKVDPNFSGDKTSSLSCSRHRVKVPGVRNEGVTGLLLRTPGDRGVSGMYSSSSSPLRLKV